MMKNRKEKKKGFFSQRREEKPLKFRVVFIWFTVTQYFEVYKIFNTGATTVYINILCNFI